MSHHIEYYSSWCMYSYKNQQYKGDIEPKDSIKVLNHRANLPNITGVVKLIDRERKHKQRMIYMIDGVVVSKTEYKRYKLILNIANV